MPDFSKYLDIDVSSIERPRALPGGHFFAQVKGWKPDERNYAKAGAPKKLTPVVTVNFTILAAHDDVDAAMVPEDLSKVAASKDYDLSDERGLYALRRLTEETVGVDTKGLHLEDALNAIEGGDVLLFNEPRAGKEEGEFYTNITKVLPVP